MELIKRVFEVTAAELKALHDLEDICTCGIDCALCEYHQDACGDRKFKLASDIEWKIIPDTVKMSHLMDVSTIQFRTAPARIVAVLAVNADDPNTFYNVFYYHQEHLTYGTATKDGHWFLGYGPSDTHSYDVIRRIV